MQALSALGYSSIYAQRPNEKKDGCLTAWKQHVFTCVLPPKPPEELSLQRQKSGPETNQSLPAASASAASAASSSVSAPTSAASASTSASAPASDATASSDAKAVAPLPLKRTHSNPMVFTHGLRVTSMMARTSAATSTSTSPSSSASASSPASSSEPSTGDADSAMKRGIEFARAHVVCVDLNDVARVFGLPRFQRNNIGTVIRLQLNAGANTRKGKGNLWKRAIDLSSSLLW
jgi:hypothetical protein